MNGIVEHVAKAIDAVQLFSRYNNWTSDHVKGFPIEICRHGLEGEDDVVVIKRFQRDENENDCLSKTKSEFRSRAAIKATLEYLSENVSEGMEESAYDVVLEESTGDGYGNITEMNVSKAAVAAALSQALKELDA